MVGHRLRHTQRRHRPAQREMTEHGPTLTARERTACRCATPAIPSSCLAGMATESHRPPFLDAEPTTVDRRSHWLSQTRHEHRIKIRSTDTTRSRVRLNQSDPLPLSGLQAGADLLRSHRKNMMKANRIVAAGGLPLLRPPGRPGRRGRHRNEVPPQRESVGQRSAVSLPGRAPRTSHRSAGWPRSGRRGPARAKWTPPRPMHRSSPSPGSAPWRTSAKLRSCSELPESPTCRWALTRCCRRPARRAGSRRRPR